MAELTLGDQSQRARVNHNALIQAFLYEKGETIQWTLQRLREITKQGDMKSFGIQVPFWTRHYDGCCHETEHSLLHAKLKLQLHKTWEIKGTWGSKQKWSTGKKKRYQWKGSLLPMMGELSVKKGPSQWVSNWKG